MMGALGVVGVVYATVAPRLTSDRRGFLRHRSRKPCSLCHDPTAARYTLMVEGGQLSQTEQSCKVGN